MRPKTMKKKGKNNELQDNIDWIMGWLSKQTEN